MEEREFIDRILGVGGKVYLVGGAVRDELMGKTVKDKDYCVAGVNREIFEKEFKHAKLQGKDFPIYRMRIGEDICEVALARKSRKVSGEGRSEINSEYVTIEDDLSRRDLTINSMAVDLSTGKLIDKFNGKEDIKNRVLKSTSEAFMEDPLRVYRTSRFASRYSFSIEETTLNHMNKVKDRLSCISYERVIKETNKALMADKPSLFFRSLKGAGVLDVHFPEIDILGTFDQPLEYHPEGDTFEHVMQVLDSARFFAKHMDAVSGESERNRYERELKFVMTALLHDVGKAVTKGINEKTGYVTYRGHETEGVPIAKGFLNRYNLISWKKYVGYGVENHMLMHRSVWEMKSTKLVDMVDGKFSLREHIDGKGKKQKYERKEGFSLAMGVSDYVLLCLADTVGRVSDRRKLVPVLNLVKDMMELYKEENILEATLIGYRIFSIIEDKKEAENMLTEIKNVLRNKLLIDLYVRASIDVGKDILIGDYGNMTGEDLGYRIHQDKRKQRVSIMVGVKKYVSELTK